MKSLNGKSAVIEAEHAEPVLAEGKQHETQKFGELIHIPLGLSRETREASVTALNHILADTMTLRDLYKKHHWQASGPTFHQLHLLFDKHYQEQATLVDLLAERIQILGGISVAMAADVAELTWLDRPPRGRENATVQITRLLGGHEKLLIEARELAKKCNEEGDLGTNDLLVSDVVRTNEFQVWVLAEHLVEGPDPS
jgi:starvation-inducible DNA-binding protein